MCPLDVRIIEKQDLETVIPELAELRISVFRDFPYLYDGDIAYEQNYLQAYRQSEQAVIIGAYEDTRLVGAATGTPLADHHDEFAEAFSGSPIDISKTFYCAESVLLPQWRGRGIGHRFFDEREAFAMAQGFTHCCFCAVKRPDNHPAQPAGYSPLDAFWKNRGYEKADGITAMFSWRDIGEREESGKIMEFWIREL
jgi:GNAT superfamily N-acetyltransferase